MVVAGGGVEFTHTLYFYTLVFAACTAVERCYGRVLLYFVSVCQGRQGVIMMMKWV